ncbi:MAG: DUF1501 domain-containing protein, partial [Verrucomicrobiaceae bacterium]
CIFMSGGNDCNNLIIPRGNGYGNYAAIRQNLAIPEPALHALSPAQGDGNDYGFHPACGGLPVGQTGQMVGGLAKLFEENKLAVCFNVGPLVHPMTRTQYYNGSVPKPPQLFSHSDQVTHWQTSLPDQPARSGWGGRIADLLNPRQNELLNDPIERAKIALCTSIAGANTFEVGNIVQQYHVSSSGAVLIGTGSGASGTNRLQAVNDLLSINSTNLQRNAYSDVMERSIATGQLLATAIEPTRDSGTTPPWAWSVPFPGTSLGNQLKMVARLIAARGALNMKRQIFFVSVGGYDTHTAQVGDNAHVGDPLYGPHATLLFELSQSLFSFQRAIKQLSEVPNSPEVPADPGLENSVTAFTASDFGRTFPTNGQGSDHGWGSHHVVMGGAVRGGRTYGRFPVLQIKGPDDTDTGRWIPSTSVDEYSATLAKWFGVSPTYMNTVFPNIGRFAKPDLGFML